MENIKLGDWYYTNDGYGDVAGYLFIARQGDFIIGAPEYYGCETITEQLDHMYDETYSEGGVNMYLHRIDECYTTLEEAEKNLVNEEDWEEYLTED